MPKPKDNPPLPFLLPEPPKDTVTISRDFAKAQADLSISISRLFAEQAEKWYALAGVLTASALDAEVFANVAHLDIENESTLDLLIKGETRGLLEIIRGDEDAA